MEAGGASVPAGGQPVEAGGMDWVEDVGAGSKPLAKVQVEKSATQRLMYVSLMTIHPSDAVTGPTSSFHHTSPP